MRPLAATPLDAMLVGARGVLGTSDPREASTGASEPPMIDPHARRAIPLLWVVAMAVGPTVARGDGPADPSGLADARLVADFEGGDYRGWTPTGDAFGTGPAQGTLPGQMAVEGYFGRGLVNSFRGGDASTGTLTSPPFPIERKAINFLVGGGKFPGETCLDLVVDGRVVRTATGPNDRPGGAERLEWHSWDVADFAGKTATIQVVDRRKDFWGHINVDHIVQSDRRLQAEPARRELVVASRYLHLPVKNGAAKRRLSFAVDGKTIREFEIELAEGPPDFWVFSDLDEFRGRTIVIAADALPPGSAGLAAIVGAETPPDPDGLYREPLRPLFHFTSRRGWLNDPNGLVYHDGEYHLYYQHNPYGREWGNMHWGHAVSPDLVRWKELPIALYPRQFGDWAFSGSAVMEGGSLLAAFTSTGRGECLVRSLDRGRTWAELAGNPAVKHAGRDPKLVWHEPTRRWIMAVYDEAEGRRAIAFHASPDLKTWTYLSRIDGFFECPDLFALPVDADPGQMIWVLYAADGRYILGTFDGKEFHKESGKHQLWHGNFYAAQTFSDTPDGRRVQIGWAQGTKFPDMPFNQQMTVPVGLTLRSTPEGVRLFAEPVNELATLRVRSYHPRDLTIEEEDRTLEGMEGEGLAVRVEIETGRCKTSGVTVRGVPITYDSAKRQLSCGGVTAPLDPEEGRVRLKILVDRGSIEVFGNNGRVALSVAAIPAAGNRKVTLFARGGEAYFRSIVVDELGSSWGR
jgi:fructan beta-fructosidase